LTWSQHWNKGTKECGMKGLQFHTFSYSWQISSHKRHKRVWCERIAISYINSWQMSSHKRHKRVWGERIAISYINSWQISSHKRHKRVWCERIAISYIFIFMTDFKSQNAQKSVVWKDCDFIHFHIHDRFQVPKGTKECGVKGLPFHTFSYSWQMSSPKRHKRVWGERIAISYIFIFMTDFKSQNAQKSVVWKDCNFIHFHIHDRFQVTKVTKECGVKELQFHIFSYSWQISHLRSKNSL